MDIFKEQNLLEFSEHFKTDLDCKKYLANFKWGKDFKCLKYKGMSNGLKKASLHRFFFTV